MSWTTSETIKFDRHVWRSRVSLICFDVVEFHYPDRVMWQFGFVKPMPIAVDTNDCLHKKDRRALSNWPQVDHSVEWSQREEFNVQGTSLGGASLLMDDYMTWYRCIMRLLISGTFRRWAPSYYQPSHTSLLLGG